MHRYLGTDPEGEIQRIRLREADWFALAEEVAFFSGGLIEKLAVPRGDTRLFLGALLFRRIAGSFEAVLVLAERGMHTEGLALRRALLEALFILGAIRNQAGLVNTYLEMDIHRRRDIFKNIKKLNPKISQALAPEITSEMVDSTIAELEAKAKGTTYLGPMQFAQAAKLYDIYLTDYSFLSEAAHHAGKDLERNIALDGNQEVDGLFWGPERNMPSELLFPAVEQMLIAAFISMKLFKINVSTAFKQLQRRMQEMPIPSAHSK
jgi:hypothetical protein